MYKEHEYYLKRCIEISKHSREAGNTPFGAILVDAEGNILLEQENVEISSKKCWWNGLLSCMKKISYGTAHCTPPRSPAPCAPEPFTGAISDGSSMP